MTDDEKIVEALSSLGSMSSEMLAIYLEMDVASVRAILPLFDGDLWFQQADDLWHVMDEEGQEIYEQLARQEAARQKLPKYNTALTKLRGLVSWYESTPIPLERWTINGVSKWMEQYNAALNLCSDLEDDLSERYIDEDLFDELVDFLSQAERYTSYLPKQFVSEYADNRIRNSAAFSVLSHKPIHIADAEMTNTPINIYRRKLGGAQLQMEDLSLITHYASGEKVRYHFGDLFCERMARIPELLREEELEYYKAYQQGNMAARDAIIESAMPSAMALAVKFLPDEEEDEPDMVPMSHRVTYDDLVQYVALIICESFNEYYPTPVTQFKRFALSNIRKRLGDFIVQEECLLSYRKPSALELNGYRSSYRDTDDYASLGSDKYTPRSSNDDDVDYVSAYGMEKADFETWIAHTKDHPIRMVKELYQESSQRFSIAPSVPKPSPRVFPDPTPKPVEAPVVVPQPKVVEPVKVKTKPIVVAKPLDRRSLRLTPTQQKRLTNLYKYGRYIQDIAKAINASEDSVRYYIDILHLEEKFGQARKKTAKRQVEQQPVVTKQEESSQEPPTKFPAKTGQPWWPEDDEKLRLLVAKGTSIDELASIFERTDKGIYYHMQQIGIITKDQNPYEASAKELELASSPMPTKPSIKLWNEAFAYTSSSYKYLWALALVDYFFRHKKETVEANILVEQMIAVAWRGILVQGLSFGKTDKMESVIRDLKKSCKLADDATDKEILDALREARHLLIYQKCMETLLQNVPYRFLSPWIPFESNHQVVQQSAGFKKCSMYAVEVGSDGMTIRINPRWHNYIMKNKVEMLNFVRESFQAYLQKRNPNKDVKFK